MRFVFSAMALQNFPLRVGWNFGCVARYFSNEAKMLRPSYSFMPGDAVLLPYSMGKLVDIAADAAGDTPAFISAHQGTRRTFSEFKNAVDKLASGLLSLGLVRGDRVGFCAPNMDEWPIVQFATAKAGLIMVSINPAYQKDEMEFCLNKVSCKALITIKSVKMQNFYDMLCSIMPELPSGKLGSLKSEKVKHLRSVILISDKAESGTITFDQLSDAGGSQSKKLLDEAERKVQFDDPINIHFTSGTTGYPKAAVLSHHNIVNNALLAGRRLGYLQEHPVVCLQIPLYHCFAGVLGTIGTLLFHHTCVFPSVGYDCLASIKTVQDYKCTAIYGTPTMFVDLLNNYKPEVHDISSLKQALIGGAACPQTVFEEIHYKLNIKHVHNGYGTTECSPGISVSGLDDHISVASTGYAPLLEFVEVKVINGEGAVVPIGTQGELCTRGYHIFMGYWGQEDKTAEVIDKERWYHTGDFAIMNEQGLVKITSRKKDMVIRGGENLFPLEVENFIHTNQAVSEVHICSVPDERLGEELCAWIKLKEGENLTEKDIKDFCKGKISHFKIPRYIMFVDDFPKTSTGKIQKYKMSEKSIEILKL